MFPKIELMELIVVLKITEQNNNFHPTEYELFIL